MAVEYFVNCHHGNAFDQWIQTGTFPRSAKDTEFLRMQCAPGLYQSRLYAENHMLTYQTELEPLEIRFAKIRPVEL